MAEAFPLARIDAVDLSHDALAVAQENVADYGMDTQITLHHGDALAPLKGRKYDLILSNPPYVTDADMACLPEEYLHEPEISLGAGEDGLEVRITSYNVCYTKLLRLWLEAGFGCLAAALRQQC